jgi:hypothetical protein
VYMKSRTAKAIVAAWMALATATLYADAPAGTKRWPGPQGSTYAAITQLPDWSGVWTITHDSVGKLLAAIRALEPGNPWTPHLTPVYEAKRRAYIEALHTRAVVDSQPDNNSMHCLPNGMPAMMVIPAPIGFEFLFTPGRVTLLSEESPPRRIYTDGRAHSQDVESTYSGESTGHWEGQTLLIDTETIDANAQLLIFNVHGSGQTHVVERVHLADPTHLQIDTTVEDPLVLTDPWRYSATYEKSNLVMGEFLCDNKNNRERAPELDLTPPSQ